MNRRKRNSKKLQPLSRSVQRAHPRTAATLSPRRDVFERALRFEALEERALLSSSPALVSDQDVATKAMPALTAFSLPGAQPGSGSAKPSGYTPTQLADAYGFNLVSFGSVHGDGAGQTIAIIDEYDDPAMVSSTDPNFMTSDLHYFDKQYGLQDPPSFLKVDQNGGTNYPARAPHPDPKHPTAGTWGEETSLDVEWAHALAPGASIILIEETDWSAAVDYARTIPSVSVISMSFTVSFQDTNHQPIAEVAGETVDDSIFTTPSGHSGITFVAATGDEGEPGGYPAYSPNVVAVGGTRLNISGTTNSSEYGWSGSGGGISSYELQPTYQANVVDQALNLNTTHRTIPDVSMESTPGVPIYDSYDFGTVYPWYGLQGTSLATPCFAALIAIANEGRVLGGKATLQGASQTLPGLYASQADFNDITTTDSAGGNGFKAGPGYDLVTGLGSPKANLLVPDLVKVPNDDRTAPTVTQLSVNLMSVAQSSTLTISWNAIDNSGGTGVNHVGLFLYHNGSPVDTTSRVLNGTTSGFFASVTLGQSPYNFTIPGNLPAGSGYEIEAIAVDAEKNQSLPKLSDNSFTVTLATQSLPTLQINNVSKSEGNSGFTAFTFTVTLSAAPSQPVTVQYQTPGVGTATLNDDYLAASGTLTFTSQLLSQSVVVQVKGDRTNESDEWFQVELFNVNAYARINNPIGIGTIVNDDQPPPVAIRIDGTTVTEGDAGTSIATFKVSLSPPPTATTTVNWATVPDTAQAGSDYQSDAGTLTFVPGQSSVQFVSINIVGDTTPEQTEMFYVQLSNPVGGTITNGEASCTILDNDLPTVGIGNSPRVVEGNSGTSFAYFPIVLSATSPQTVTVQYSTKDLTATVADHDYQSTSGTLTFSAGQKSGTISVPIYGDTIPEADEMFGFLLSSPTNAQLDPNASSATGTIANDDFSTLPQLTIVGTTVTEGDVGTTPATVTVQLSAPSAQTITVSYQTQDVTAIVGSDYQFTSGTLTFAPKQTSKQITVQVINDLIPENDKYFRVTLLQPAGATIAAPSAPVNIIDNDTPTIGFSDQSFTEGTGGTSYANFTVTLSTILNKMVSVQYITAGGTATTGTDFQFTNGTLVFPAGQTSETISVPLMADSLPESNETFYLEFSNPVNAKLGSKTYAVGTILDDDTPAQPSISIADVSLPEGNSGTTAFNFTVTLSAPSTQPVTVTYSTADGTAVAGADYIAANGTITFKANQRVATITVLVNGDTTAEADEEFFVNLLSATNATLACPPARGTIQNDDGNPPVTISINDVAVEEGDSGQSLAVFTVTLSQPASQKVIVNYASQDDSASSSGSNSDYTAVYGGLTFNIGQWTQTISVPINGDTTVEPDENYFINLSAPVNATIAKGTGRGTIFNDDCVVVPSITVKDESIPEGNSGTTNMFFTVQLSEKTDETVTVDYGTADGTATAGADYVAESGTLTFIPGETFKVVAVPIKGDTTPENDESFAINLMNPTNGTIGRASAVGTIVNDDVANGTIEGRLFDDLNGNGIYDVGDPTLAGQVVYLDLNGDKQLNNGEPSTTTDANGNYIFTGITAGEYQVRQVVQAGWSQTYPQQSQGAVQLTTGTDLHYDATSDGNEISWLEQLSGTSTVDVWEDDATGEHQLTDEPIPTSGLGGPQVDNGEFIFTGTSGTSNQIFIRANGNTIQLTTANAQAEKPEIDRGQIVWFAYNNSTGVEDVFRYDGSSVSELSPDDGIDDYNPQISGGQVVWQHGDGAASQIMYFNGTTTIQLTTSATSNSAPQIDGGKAVWQGWDGNDWEIYYYDGSSIQQLTTDSYDDTNPQISNGQVTWIGNVTSNNPEVFTYNFSTKAAVDLSSDNVYDTKPSVSDGRIAWATPTSGTNGSTIMVHDATGNSAIVARPNPVQNLVIAGNILVWQETDGTTLQIFEYVLSDSQMVQVSAGQAAAEVDFGSQQLQTVSGMKFNDLNGNGLQDPGEPGLAGWTIQLDEGADGTVDKTTVTDADGNYSFSNVPVGPYLVSAVPQAGWQSTTADQTDNASLGPAVSAGSMAVFGAFLPITLSGQVFVDANDNGVLDTGESPLTNWTVQLDPNSDGSATAVLTTDANGAYTFSNVGPGAHTIVEVPPPGWQAVYPLGQQYAIVSGSGQAVGNLNFGNRQPPSTSGIANVTAIENATNTIINLWTAFSDPVDNSSALQYSIVANSNNSLVTSTTIDSAHGTLTLKYAANTVGSANITVQAINTGGLSVQTAFATSVAPGAATQLIITSQPPSTVMAGSGFGLTVVAEDANQNVVTSFAGSVTVGLASNPGSSALGGMVTVSAANGVATFSGLNLTKVGSGYKVAAISGMLTSATSSTISVAPGTATQLIITSQPQSAVTAGGGFGFSVAAQDAQGNLVTNYTGSVTVALVNNAGNSTLGGVLAVSVTSGVAIFSGLTLNKSGSGYTLEVSTGSLTSAPTIGISVVPGAASQLIIGAQPPTTITAGAGFGFTVTAEDAEGNVATGFSGGETVALASNPGSGKLGGTVTASASGGVVVFSGLSLNNVGNGYTLDVDSGGLSSAISGEFNVVPAGPTTLTITGTGSSNNNVSIAFISATQFDVISGGTTTPYSTSSINQIIYNAPTGSFSEFTFDDPSGSFTATQSLGSATISQGGLQFQANGVANLYIYGGPGSSATINVGNSGSSSNFFVDVPGGTNGSGSYSYIADPGTGAYSELGGFGSETITGSGGTTYAYVYSTSQASTVASPTQTTFTVGGVTSTLSNFPQVYVVGAADGTDSVTLNSSGGGFVATPGLSYVSGGSGASSFIIGALYCANVTAQATNATDSAFFYSYPADTFNGAQGTSTLVGSASAFASFSTFVSQANGFQSVGVGESGGATDVANLTSPGDAAFNETPTVSTLVVNSITEFTIDTYVISGSTFIAVPSKVNVTGNANGTDTANLTDAAGSNTLVVGGNKATLTTPVNTVSVTQFGKVNAVKQSGTSNTAQMAAALDFVLSDPGWTGI